MSMAEIRRQEAQAREHDRLLKLVETMQAELNAWRYAWDGRQGADFANPTYADPEHDHERPGWWDGRDRCASCLRFEIVKDRRAETDAANAELIAGAPKMEDEIARLREQVRVLREAAQWVIDARNGAGNDALVRLIIGAERCSDAMDAAKEAKP